MNKVNLHEVVICYSCEIWLFAILQLGSLPQESRYSNHLPRLVFTG